MLALKEFPEIEQSAGTMLAPYQFGSSNSRYTWHGRKHRIRRDGGDGRF